MINIIKNTPEHVIFEKDTREEKWFENKCSDAELLKHCNRTGETIKRVQWEDGKHTASLLNIYF